MRLSNIYQINIDRKDGNKANIDIRYKKGKCRILHSFDVIETSFGLTLMKKEDAVPDGCQDCIIGLLKRFFRKM